MTRQKPRACFTVIDELWESRAGIVCWTPSCTLMQPQSHDKISQYWGYAVWCWDVSLDKIVMNKAFSKCKWNVCLGAETFLTLPLLVSQQEHSSLLSNKWICSTSVPIMQQGSDLISSVEMYTYLTYPQLTSSVFMLTTTTLGHLGK